MSAYSGKLDGSFMREAASFFIFRFNAIGTMACVSCDALSGILSIACIPFKYVHNGSKRPDAHCSFDYT